MPFNHYPGASTPGLNQTPTTKIMKPNPSNPLNHLTEAEAQAQKVTRQEINDALLDRGVPHHIAYRLAKLRKLILRIGRTTYRIGDILLRRLLEFLRQYPGLAIGTALGAALGFLFVSVPIIGPYIAPILTVLGGIFGAAIGHAVDEGTLRGSLPALVYEAVKQAFATIVEAIKEACAAVSDASVEEATA